MTRRVLHVLPAERIHPLRFGRPPLDFPLPGMSDVMPYRSTVWPTMTAEQLATYRRAWAEHLGPLIDRVEPDVIHANHVWILSSMLADVAPGVPVVVHSHGTGLRQMRLCPHLADRVRRDSARTPAGSGHLAGPAATLHLGGGLRAHRGDLDPPDRVGVEGSRSPPDRVGVEGSRSPPDRVIQATCAAPRGPCAPRT